MHDLGRLGYARCMSDRRGTFIDFMCRSSVLTFGDFVTKSGRATPYFINTGAYSTGAQMKELGETYAQVIVERFGDDFDVLFGPAYKGIPLAATTAIALSARHDLDKAFCFDRKEPKDHGEGGSLVGHRLRDGDRVLIVEDVTTAGTSIRETVPKLVAAADVVIVGLLVSVDRLECGPSTPDRGALQTIGEEFSMRTEAIVDLDDLIEHLAPDGPSEFSLDPAQLERIREYRRTYGVPRRVDR